MECVDNDEINNLGYNKGENLLILLVSDIKSSFENQSIVFN